MGTGPIAPAHHSPGTVRSPRLPRPRHCKKPRPSTTLAHPPTSQPDSKKRTPEERGVTQLAFRVSLRWLTERQYIPTSGNSDSAIWWSESTSLSWQYFPTSNQQSKSCL